MAKLGIDCDGVIADWNKAYAYLLIEEDGNRFPEGYDISNPPCWNWDTYFGYDLAVQAKVWKHIKSDPLFWQQLEPLEGAKEAIRYLNKMAKAGDDVYYLTNRTGYKVKQQTEKFLYELGADYPTVVITADKIPVIRALGIDFFIDDRLDMVNEVARVAEEEKLFIRLFLKDAPWNQTGRRADLKIASSLKDALTQAGLWV